MINYAFADDLLAENAVRDILITDGTVVVSGTNYIVTGQTVVIDNSILQTESLVLTQSLCSQSQITFGSCEAAELAFEIFDNIPTLKGKVLKAYIFPNRDASKMLQLGVFKVYEDELASDRIKRSVKAYDAMYDILNADVADWYNTALPSTSSSMTLAQFRASFLSYFGITAESATLANDTITIKRTIGPDSLSGADVIKAICEINGVFGTITNEGKFRFVELTAGIDDGLFPSDTLYPADDLYPQDVNPYVTPVAKSHYIDATFEDYNSESITGLTIRTNEDDVGASVGTGTNRYVITGNFLVFGYSAADLATAATNCFNKIKNRYYRPAVVNAAGNPLHEVGDPIRVSTTYRGIVTYILERKLSGIQALHDTYTAQGEQYFGEQLNSSVTQFKQLASKTLQLKADVDGVSAELTEQLDASVVGSYAYMTSQQIGLKVSKSNLVGDLDDEMGSYITITANRITFGSSGTLVVDTSNFTLDQYGNATFGGTVSGATIQSSSIVSSGSPSGSGTSTIELDNGRLFAYTSNSNDQVSISYGNLTVSDGPNSSAVTASTIATTGKIYAGGYEVLTTNSSIPIPSALEVEQIKNTSGNARININYGTSNYDIVLNGSVNIGNGSTNDIRIKGKDIKWKKFSTLGADDYVLAEEA